MESKIVVPRRQVEAAKKVVRYFSRLSHKPESDRDFHASIMEFGHEAGRKISIEQAGRVAVMLQVKPKAVPSLHRHPVSASADLKVNDAGTYMVMGTLLLLGAANVLRIGGLALDNAIFAGAMALGGTVLLAWGGIKLARNYPKYRKELEEHYSNLAHELQALLAAA